jgi:hypothetical protein
MDFYEQEEAILCSSDELTSHDRFQHHPYLQENRISASYLHQDPLAGAWEETRDVPPFSLEKQSSHPGALDQGRMT